MRTGHKAIIALAAAATTGLLGPASAQPLSEIQKQAVLAADPLSALVGKRRARSEEAKVEVARYSVAADGRNFLVEGRIGAARLQFLCSEDDPRIDCTLDPAGPSEEIHLATAARGPRGDVIFKDAAGSPLLRIAPHGGATVFWPGRAGGEAASKSYGDDEALKLPAASHADAERRAVAATAKLSAVAGEPIEFTLGGGSIVSAAARPAPAAFSPLTEQSRSAAADERVLADAVMRAAAGMMEVAGDPTGARILGARVSRVRFSAGRPPSATLDGKTLNVIYDPAADAEGRPSSRAIAAFLEDSL